MCDEADVILIFFFSYLYDFNSIKISICDIKAMNEKTWTNKSRLWRFWEISWKND